jgi:hypothetical protein
MRLSAIGYQLSVAMSTSPSDSRQPMLTAYADSRQPIALSITIHDHC